MKRYINLNAGFYESEDGVRTTPEVIAEFAAKDGSNTVAFIERDSFVGYSFVCEKIRRATKKDFKVLYGASINVKKELGDNETIKATLIAKNEAGIKNIYKLVSISRMDRPCEADWACVSYDEITKHRDNILVGFELSGDTFAKSVDSDICKLYDFADFVGISKDVAVNNLREIVSGLSPKICVAVCDRGTFLTTEEMLDIFGGDDLAQALVISGPNAIADRVEKISVCGVRENLYRYTKEGEELKTKCEKKLLEKYGPNVPELIRERFDDEIEKIVHQEYSPYYLIAEKLTAKCDELGYIHILGGTGASSFVNYLLGICETNPLPPHYYCNKCKRVEFVDASKCESGFDLNRRDLSELYETKICPECSEVMTGDGHNIPYEFWAGYYGAKVPDFEFRIPKPAQKILVEYLAELFGKDRVFAGRYFDGAEYPFRLCIGPESYEIFKCSPIGYDTFEDSKSRKMPKTIVDYRELFPTLFSIAFLPGDLPEDLRRMEEITGVKAKSIDISEVDIFDFFANGNFADELFGDVNYCVKEIADQVFPADFSDFVRVQGLYHGTGTWFDNAENLAAVTMRPDEVIAHREDVMFLLMRYGIDRKTAFDFAEDIRRGRLIMHSNHRTEQILQMLSESGIPELYIDSLKKIHYLFPKSDSTEFVLNCLRIIWFKMNRPEAFSKVFYRNED